MTIDTNVYFGAPGSLLTLPWPRGGIGGTRGRNVSQFLLGSGGQQVWKTLSGKRTYQLGYQSLDYATFAQLEAFDQGHNGPGPFAILDPGRRNLLTANQSAATSLTNDTTGFTIGGALMSDNFTRSVTGGWGTASSGGAWSHVGDGVNGNFSVTSFAGRINIAAASTEPGQVQPYTMTDVDITVDVSTSVVATGDILRVGAIGRYIDDNNHYLANVHFNTDSTVSVGLYSRVSGTAHTLAVATTGLTYTAGVFVRLRFVISGTSLMAKVWDLNGSGQPAAWQVTATDSGVAGSGKFGCMGRLAGTNTPPVQVSFVNFTATQAPDQISSATTARRGPRSLSWLFFNVATGAPAVTVDPPDPTWPGIPCAIRPHTFSVWALSVGGPAPIYATMTYLDPDGTTLGTSTSNVTVAGTGAWTQVAVTGTPTVGSAYLNCAVACSGAAVEANSVYLDQWMLNEGSAADSSWSPGSGVVPVQVVTLPDTQPWFYPDYRAGVGLILQEIGP